MTLQTCCCDICSLKGITVQYKLEDNRGRYRYLCCTDLKNTWRPAFWRSGQKCQLAIWIVKWELVSKNYIYLCFNCASLSTCKKMNNSQLPTSLPPGTGCFSSLLALSSPDCAQEFHCLSHWWYFSAVLHTYGTSCSALKKPTAWESGIYFKRLGIPQPWRNSISGYVHLSAYFLAK